LGLPLVLFAGDYFSPGRNEIGNEMIGMDDGRDFNVQIQYGNCHQVNRVDRNLVEKIPDDIHAVDQ